MFKPDKHVLNDINPYLINMWHAAYDGWNPPEKVTERDYIYYNKTRPINDPMTGYVGFAWSFGGKFFGGAARTNGRIKGSYKSTRDKIDVIRANNVRFTCGHFSLVKPQSQSVVYLDPPYEARTHQSHLSKRFNYDEYFIYAENLAKRHVVIATSFTNERKWKVLHNYGDTVVRHHAGKAPDGTIELLLRVGK